MISNYNIFCHLTKYLFLTQLHRMVWW